MAEISYPFDSGPGAIVTEDMWSHQAETWQDDGVCADGPAASDLKVYSNAEPYTLQVLPGRANISGFHYYLDSETSLPIEGNTASQSRYDLVVVRVDRAANRVMLAVKQGTPGSSAPTVDRSWDAREFPLAQVRVAPNSTTVAPSDVTDNREFQGRRIRVLGGGSGGVLPEGSVYYIATSKRHVAKGATSQILAYRTEAGAANVASTNRPTESFAGQLIYETDTKRTYVNTNTSSPNWAIVARQPEEQPFAVLRQMVTSVTVANGSTGYVTWSEKAADNKGGFSTATPDRYTIKETGWYDLSARVQTNAGSTSGYITAYIQRNNSISSRDMVGNTHMRPNTSGIFSFTLDGLVYLVEGDYIRLGVSNSSGSSLDVQSSQLMVRWVAPRISGQFDT